MLEIIKEQLRKQLETTTGQLKELEEKHKAEVELLVQKFNKATESIREEARRITTAICALDGTMPSLPAAAPATPQPLVMVPSVESTPATEPVEPEPPRIDVVHSPFKEVVIGSASKLWGDVTFPEAKVVTEAIKKDPEAPIFKAPETRAEMMDRVYHSRTNVKTLGRVTGRPLCPREVKLGLVTNFDFKAIENKTRYTHTGTFRPSANATMLCVELEEGSHVWAPVFLRDEPLGNEYEDSNLFEIPLAHRLHDGYIGSTWLQKGAWLFRDKFYFKNEHLEHTVQAGTHYRTVTPKFLEKAVNWLYSGNSLSISKLASM